MKRYEIFKTSKESKGANIKITDKEIQELAQKLNTQSVKEFAEEYNLTLEKARYDLAEYYLYDLALKERELEVLEEQFVNAGYSQESIDEIKYSNNADCDESYIDNLENERSYWEE